MGPDLLQRQQLCWVSVNNSSRQVPISDHDRCVWPLVLRKVHVITGHLGAEVPTMDCEMCIQGIGSQPLDSSDQRREGMNLVFLFYYEGFSVGVFVCSSASTGSCQVHLWVCVFALHFFLHLECQSLLSPSPLSVISQSFFHHSTGCLYMTDRVFLLCPKLWKMGRFMIEYI